MAEVVPVRLSRDGGNKVQSAKTLRGKKPSASGVSGQEKYIMVVCWNCWAVNEISVPDAAQVFTYNCWNCGTVGVV